MAISGSSRELRARPGRIFPGAHARSRVSDVRARRGARHGSVGVEEKGQGRGGGGGGGGRGGEDCGDVR